MLLWFVLCLLLAWLLQWYLRLLWPLLSLPLLQALPLKRELLLRTPGGVLVAAL